MNAFEDRITITYPEDVTLEMQALYAQFMAKVSELKGKTKLEEVTLIEGEYNE